METQEPDRGRDESSRNLWTIFLDLVFLGLVLWIVYFARLGVLPLCGEEPRRAEVAREMIRSGDFVVPRQQGEIYCSRPPLQNWLIALTAFLRGSWDAWTVRLPSAVATSLLTLSVYFHTVILVGRLAAITAAVALATMGQMMHIGAMGETDPLFAFLLGGSLLVWHGWLTWGSHPLLAWILGGLFAGLSGLAKGAQGPISFWLVAGAWSVVTFIWGRGRIRDLLWASVGIVVCFGILAAWTIPYSLATDLSHAWQIWFGQIESRLGVTRFPSYLLTRPIETLVCWLPWTPLLLPFASRKFWNQLPDREKQIAQFCVVALAITFPTVWLVPEARNRYFLGLYPFAAILVGLVVDQATRPTPSSPASAVWQQFLKVGAIVGVVLAGVGLVGVLVAPHLPISIPWHPIDLIGYLALTGVFWVVVWGGELGRLAEKAEVVWDKALPRNAAAVFALGGLIGFAHITFVHSAWVAVAHDPSPQIATIRKLLPHPEELVSFGPVFHRFRYYYELPIRMLPQPKNAADVPPEVTYFCVEGVLTQPKPTAGEFLRILLGQQVPKWNGYTSFLQDFGSGLYPDSVKTGRESPPQEIGTDSTLVGQNGRGSRLELPELPFDWEVVAVVPCGRNKTERIQPAVVVGRIVRSSELARNPAKSRLY